MTRVLLVCPEPLGHGQPAGIGIRFLEMAKVLIEDGHQVSILSRDGAPVQGCRSLAATPANIATATAKADVAIVQGHIANDLFAHGVPLPTAVDLYDPFIIENLHYYSERGSEVFQHDHATLLNSVAHGDFFICASEAQRHFYLGLLLAAGRLNPEVFDSDPDLQSIVGIAPFGVQPPRTLAVTHAQPDILFGGIYDWYDPLLAIDAIVVARETIPNVSITFTRHPNPELTPQGRTAAAIEYAQRKGYGRFVHFEPWFAYDRRGDFFDHFALALLTFPRSIETDLSMRTRVYDYLWGGLPIITSSAPGTDEILQRYGAGIVIPTNSPEAFADAIVATVGDAAGMDGMRRGAQAFVAEHQWGRALEPLRRFCRDPRIDHTKNDFGVRFDLPRKRPSIFSRIRRRIGGAH